ncbi:MAG TPA: glycosyl hydrolase family 18 protein [Candidatus Limnocylindria bacterium]
MRRLPAAILGLLLTLGSMPTAAVRAADPSPASSVSPEPLATGAVLTADGRVLPPMPAGMEQTSVHAEMLAAHAADVVRFTPGGAPSVLLTPTGKIQMAGAAVAPDGGAVSAQVSAAGLPNGLRKEVFGFLPYWMLSGSALSSMNYHLVSTIAYFSVNAKMTGYLAKGTSTNPTAGWAGWKSSAMTGVLNRAHEQGVRVVLTVTMMAWDSASASRQASLLQTASARSRLVNQIVSAVRDRGADGVNLDFEPLATSLRDEYVSFVKQLKRGLANAGVGDYLTVSVMASAATWATGYDVAGLTAADAADALFVMGYDYNWSGSSRAGGVAPIQSPFTIDVAGTMADFLTQTSGSKLIWGVPYYGRTWPTKAKTLNSATLGGGSKAYTYTGHLAEAGRYGRRWDDVGKVPWYRHWDGAAGHWVQGYYDDSHSLGVKYDLVNSRGLKGTGMWTLLMDQGRDELWRLLARKFVNDTAPPVGGISLLPSSVDGEAFKVSWRAQDYASGVSTYGVQWRRPGGVWQQWLSNTKATSAWFTGTAGRTYQFRMRAIDAKGNVQPWTSPPATPTSLTPAAFGKVVAATLNVRTGPGTGYGIIDSAAAGDLVYVLEGPVSSGGYEWYRVQYGFTEWPSADYPTIAWMAGSSSGTPMIAPAQAPAVTRLRPFVSQGSRTAAFSPNGDGVQDSATIGFNLAGATSATRLEIVDDGGAVVRSIGLGARSAGANQASWNGQLASGDPAPDGRYLARIVATDGSGTLHVGPSGTLSAAALKRWGITVDDAAPGVDATPGSGTSMVPAMAKVEVAFTEPMAGLDGAAVQLTADGVPLAAHAYVRADDRSVLLRADDPLPTGAAIGVVLDASVRDAAGNRPAMTAWTFSTAPGRAYDPARHGTLRRGTRTGYAIGADGDLLLRHTAGLSAARDVTLSQRAVLPNLPGRWLYARSGPLAGRWLRETANQHVDGFVSRTTYDTAQRIKLRAGDHLGYRFTLDGRVLRTKRLSLRRGVLAASSVRAVINGVTWWRLSGGALDGYWVEQSAAVHRRGAVGRLQFAAPPRVDVAAGTYTAYSYDWLGRVRGSVTAKVGSSTGVRVAAWAVINGTPRYLVSSGPWAGMWLAETSDTRLHV